MHIDTSNAHAIIHSLKQRGYSQADIGGRIGKSQAVISRWGKCEGYPNRSEYTALVKLCEEAPTLAKPPRAGSIAHSKISSTKKITASPQRHQPTVNIGGVASISVPADGTLLDLVGDLELSLETLFTSVGTEAVRAEVKRLWQEKNRAAIEERNAYFEKHGLPLAKYRAF